MSEAPVLFLQMPSAHGLTQNVHVKRDMLFLKLEGIDHSRSPQNTDSFELSIIKVHPCHYYYLYRAFLTTYVIFMKSSLKTEGTLIIPGFTENIGEIRSDEILTSIWFGIANAFRSPRSF